MDPIVTGASHDPHRSKRHFVYASKSIPCPICAKTDWCSLELDDERSPFLAVCGRNVDPPDGWIVHGPSRDGRTTFIKSGRANRKHFPSVTTLERTPKADTPQWIPKLRHLDTLRAGDLIRLKVGGGPKQIKKIMSAKGDGHGQRCLIGPWQYDTVESQEVFLSDIAAIHTDDGDGSERTIEYLYPSPITNEPVGKVIRTEWSDRRPVYHNNRRNKMVIPWHWSSQYKEWKLGAGEESWPLYREDEARENILNGGIVFAVAGEQAVECYRALGLTATCTAGGETRWQQIIDSLESVFAQAKEHMKKPLLVIHPDFDIVGETEFSTKLLERCRIKRIPAVSINPLDLWNKMPHKGDIKDWLDSGIESDTAVRVIATAINTALDYEERELDGRAQRELWNAPSSYKGELGLWKPVGQKDDPDFEFQPLADFDFQIERELADSKGGGLLLQFKKTDDRHQRRVFIKSTDYSSATKFIDAIKKALYSGVVCNLSNQHIQALIRVRLHEYRITRRGKIYFLVERVGQQQNGGWVFPNTQLTPQGDLTTEEDSKWCWHSDDTEGGNHLPIPRIKRPNPNTLTVLVHAMRAAFGPEVIHQGILTLGYAAATAHYQAIMAHQGCFPLFSLYADPGCGKTTLAECAVSLFGMLEEGIYSQITISAMFEKLKLAGSLLHCLDDPKRDNGIASEEALKAIYNGHPRIVRGSDSEGFNKQKPHSPLMITANAPMGENSQALKTRMIQIFVPKRDDINRDAFPSLRSILKEASGALPTLIKFGYDPDAIQSLEERLRPLMPHANGRFPQSLALILHYATLIVAHTGLDIDIQGWAENTICPEFNDVEAAGDSIRDFLEKLFVLKTEAKIGDWNMRIVKHNNSTEAQGLAIHMASVWPHLDQNYVLPYNRQIIERLLVEKGAIKGTGQKFHENKDVSITYSRAGQGDKVNTLTRKCLLIPMSVLKFYSDIGVTEVTEVTENSKNLETIAQLGIERLPIITNNKVTDIDKKVTEVTGGDQGEGAVTFSNPSVTFLGNKEVTAGCSAVQGEEQSGYPVTSVTSKNTPSLEKESDWIQCDETHTPAVGAEVRILTGRRKGVVCTVEKIHTSRVTVSHPEWDRSSSYLFENLEMKK